MALNVKELMLRIVEIQKVALATLSVTADAVPYFYHVQEAFPYFTNRLGGDEVNFDSEDYDRDTYTVIMRLVIAHLTSGYKGEPETRLFEWCPVIKTYFNEREWLQSAAYPTELVGLIRARVTAHAGLRTFENAGISAIQVGTEFVLTCEFDESITQAYT